MCGFCPRRLFRLCTSSHPVHVYLNISVLVACFFFVTHPSTTLSLSLSLSRFDRDAILSLDETVLTSERVHQLLKLCPTKEDMEALSAFDGDLAQLGRDEKFMFFVFEFSVFVCIISASFVCRPFLGNFAMTSLFSSSNSFCCLIPHHSGNAERYFLCLKPISARLESRLQLFAFKLGFDGQASEIEESLIAVEQAAAGLCYRREFQFRTLWVFVWWMTSRDLPASPPLCVSVCACVYVRVCVCVHSTVFLLMSSSSSS